jgi:type IV pilus biogenesis protein CpaD/CtpE
MQKCESVPELIECKKWIASFISAAPDMTADCKRSVRMFFQRKYSLRSQWVLAFRLKRRSYNVAASSRVEGEFGVVNRLNMSGAMNFRTGITKMRFSSSNRQVGFVRAPIARS